MLREQKLVEAAENRPFDWFDPFDKLRAGATDYGNPSKQSGALRPSALPRPLQDRKT